jgi:hypothetical protein
MADSIFEHASEVRAALRVIVSDHGHGADALSDPVRMTNLLRDLMPDAPRETGLLIAAAQTRLAEILRGHASSGLDARTAARLAAADFAANTAFSQEVCEWVTGELATALGLWAAAEPSTAAAASGGLSEPSSAVTVEVARHRPPDAATELPLTGAPVADGAAVGGVAATLPGAVGAAPLAIPRRRRFFRRWMLIPIGLVVAIGAVAGIIGAVTSKSAPRKLTIDQFRVGDCLVGPSLGLHTNHPWPYQVEGVSCTTAHKAEVFFTGVVWPRSLAYPAVSDIVNKTESRCQGAFRGYVGIPLSQSQYNFTGIYPNKGSWAAGDRSVRCIAYKPVHDGPGGVFLYRSVKGSHR